MVEERGGMGNKPLIRTEVMIDFDKVTPLNDVLPNLLALPNCNLDATTPDDMPDFDKVVLANCKLHAAPPEAMPHVDKTNHPDDVFPALYALADSEALALCPPSKMSVSTVSQEEDKGESVRERERERVVHLYTQYIGLQ
jgi:hypothetical protein